MSLTYYEYNYKGQLTEVKDSLGNVTTYTYGGTGCSSCGGGTDKLTAITDAKGNATKYEYDRLGRPTKETDPLGNAISYSYDSKGNLLSKTDANGATTSYSYDGLGRLLKKAYPDNTTESFTYDAKGNILTATNSNISYTLSYNTNGKGNGITTATQQQKEFYIYDPVGNRLSSDKYSSYTYNQANQLQTNGGTYSYDKNGNLTTKVDGTTTYSYSYDYENRLTKVVKTENSTTTTSEYKYDPFGRRIEKKVEKTDTGVTATLEDGRAITAELCLVSIGRALNNENIGLEKLGVAQGKRGEITVNEKMETNVPGIYAIGDITGKIMLAHVASTQGLVAVENIMGHERVMNYDVVPAGIFTIPEIGSVGLREHWASAQGIDVKIGRFNFRTLGKAQAMGEIAGMVKIIADAKTDKVLGCHIIGAHATDIIHEAAVAMQKGMTVKELGETIHSHPTLSEAVMEATEDLHGLCIHAPKK